LHEEHDTGSVFCKREQEQRVGAEVEQKLNIGGKERRPVKLQPPDPAGKDALGILN